MHPKPFLLRSPIVVLGALTSSLLLAGACSATGSHVFGGAGGVGNASTVSTTDHSGAGATTASGNGGGLVHFDAGHLTDSGSCTAGCSSDLHTVVDCMGNAVQTCTGTNGCDHAKLACTNACQATVDNKLAVGCEYYATFMDQDEPGVCFAAFVANTWNGPVHINVDFAGTPLSVASFARIPSGSGPTLSYGAYDPVAGLPEGQVAILFLSGDGSSVPCPAGITSAVPSGAQIFNATGIGNSFHITTDVPVVAYEINPYGGGSAAVTGASLLLPTSVWDTNYLAVTAAPDDIYGPSMNVIAAEDGTQVTMLPSVAVQGGGALPPGRPARPTRSRSTRASRRSSPRGRTSTAASSRRPSPSASWPGSPACGSRSASPSAITASR